MNETLRVGFVGFGFIGKVHAYGYRTISFFSNPLPFETLLAGVCTSRPETAEQAKEDFGFEFCTMDFREITENSEIDVVHICTPNSLHREELLSAIAAGKHIYCDKPLTATWNEAKEVLEAMKGYKGIHQMTLQNRFFPVTMRAKQLVDEGFLGRPLSFRACYLHSGSADPKAPLKWKLDRAYGGGVLLDLGTHVLDLVLLLLGQPSEVLLENNIAYSQRPTLADPSKTAPVEAEDQALMMLRFPDGSLGTVEASKIAVGTEDELRVEIHGSEGALRFNLADPNHLEVYRQMDPNEPLGGVRGWRRIDTVQHYDPWGTPFPNGKMAVGWMRSHASCLHNFLSAIAGGRKAEPGMEVGARLQQIAGIAQCSASERRWLPVPSSLAESQ